MKKLGNFVFFPGPSVDSPDESDLGKEERDAFPKAVAARDEATVYNRGGAGLLSGY